MTNTEQKRLLLADNDTDYRQSLHGLLELENYLVEDAASPEEAESKLEVMQFDLVLVDLRLVDDRSAGDFSGLEIAKKAKEADVLCIVISAFPSVEVTRRALRARGAEPLVQDFVPKMNGPQAVLDTIKEVLENFGMIFTAKSGTELKIDLNRKLVWYREELLKLSSHQYDLLAYMCQKQGGVCSGNELLKVVYHEEAQANTPIVDRRLERLVDRLREKIEEDPSQPRHLMKVQGRGYRLVL